MDEKPTIGIATIVRGGADGMRRSLLPFTGLVDEIAIVLGGHGTPDDKRVRRLARKWATPGCLAEYQGDLDENGRLLNFGAARQQATDLLSTDWMLVVDADEIWHGVELMHDLAGDAQERGFQIVMFGCRVDHGRALQPRLYKRDSGQWVGPVHEHWELDDPTKAAMVTDAIWIEQNKPPGSNRRGQNIAIAERWLADNEPAARVLAHLGRDYLIEGRLDEALDAFNQYLLIYDAKSRRLDELFQVHYSRGAAFLRLDRYADALQAAALALSVRSYGMAWTLMAEAAMLLANTSTDAWALALLAVDCADKAISSPVPDTSLWMSRDMATSIPLKIKARALARMQRWPESLAYVEILGQMGDDEAEKMEAELCQRTKMMLR